jgi:predicted nuclease of predicted toxin-antitoxin system
MSEKIRFHTDENVGLVIAQGLRRRGVDVITTPEADLMGVSDEVQLAFAKTQGRVIFTQDTDFLRLHQAGVEHVGIVFCAQSSCSIGEIIRGLILIWELLEPLDMLNHVEFL